MDSQAIVNTMEVLETKPITDLVSEAIIKVCYVSPEPNPNDTVITREIGKEIAATLPGAPVAGFFDKETGDFVEHSRRITFSNGEFEIEDLTKPYGFVDPNTNPWYQDFEEEGKVRTYLMCKAYLWTRQYEEASLAFNKGQSMELDEKRMAGYYQGNVFVFTTATLDKLCILGDAYAPCFAGAKIMSTYAKQYESLAEKLEKTLGRRYYVMNDQLVVKPEGTEEVKAPFSLDYAVQLGWNLTDAIYMQLTNRGAQDKYAVEGIYADSGSIFAILQDRTSLEFVRCDVVITAADTVELGSEMLAVKQTWSVKAPPAPEPTEPLNGGSAVPEQNVPMNVAATYAEGTPADPALPTEEPAKPAEDFAKKDDKKDDDKKANDKKADDKTDDGDAKADDKTDDSDAKADDKADDKTDDEDDKKKKKDFSASSEGTDPTVDFTLELAQKDAKITELEEALTAYRAAEALKAEEQKAELISSYSEILTEEEMAPIVEKVADYTLEALEAKFAVVYARKARTAPTSQFQVNINHLTTEDDSNLPDFMKQALEYDKAKEIRL